MRYFPPLRARSLVVVALIVVSALLALIGVRDGVAGNAPIVLVVDNVSADEAAGGPFMTPCTATPNDCSLRGAIVRSNNSVPVGGNNRIEFRIATGPQTISLTKALPHLTSPVDVTGLTQPTNQFTTCFVFTGQPCITINGTGSGQSGSGLVLEGDGSSVQGVAIISFGGAGIEVASSNNFIDRNYIGTSDGVTDLGSFFGVNIQEGTQGNVIGSFRNVISGNNVGIITAGDSVVIQGNFIGLTESGASALPNTTGILVSGGSATIGGEGFLRNWISGNAGSGIEVTRLSGEPAPQVDIVGNYIGPGFNGVTDVGNGTDGVAIGAESDVTIGGPEEADRNIISGNDAAGVSLVGIANQDLPPPSGVQILNNYIGTDVTGGSALANRSGGVLIQGASDTVVGLPGMGNVISGNFPDAAGILIAPFSAPSTGNVIQGNIIGMDASGLSILPNGEGVRISAFDQSIVAEGNVVGGDGVGEGNLITNVGAINNVAIVGTGASDNSVMGNRIGLDANDATDFGFGVVQGVVIEDSSNNTIGGASVGARNVIAYSTIGVSIAAEDSVGNVVQGNYIGTSVDGLMGGRANFNGIADSGSSSRIVDNLVSGNENGIAIRPNNHIVQGNRVGLAADGSPLPNTSHGIFVTGGGAGGALIGGGGSDANEIANNGGAGVRIDPDAAGVTITRNSVHDNLELGIDIEPGSNADVPAPTLTSAEVGANTRIVGTFAGDSVTEYRFEFFRNEACDPSGFGEGETFIASEELSTNGAGEVEIDLRFATSTTPGQLITATATDQDGNTSEFSNCATVVEAPATPTPDVTGSATPVATTPVPSVTATPAPADLLGDADCDGDVDANDILAVLQDVGDIPPGACELADSDCDHRINEEDALRIALHLADIPLDVPDDCRAIET